MSMLNPFIDETRDQEDLAYSLKDVKDDAIAKLASGEYKLVKASRKTPPRKRFTAADYLYLEWLHKFKIASASNLGVVAGVKDATAYKRLLGLERVGLVKKLPVWNAETQWTLTREGARMLGDQRWTVRSLPESILHTRVINHVAANFAVGNHQVLGAPEGLRLSGSKLGAEGLTSEFEIQRSMGYLMRAMNTETQRTVLRKEWRMRLEEWGDSLGTETPLTYPAWVEGEEWGHAIIPQFNRYGSYHVPDLVIRRDRSTLMRATDVAVEVETSAKKARDYRRIMEVYRGDFFARGDYARYSQVVWLCRYAKTHKEVSAAAEYLGILGTKVIVDWVRDAEGERVTDAYWSL